MKKSNTNNFLIISLGVLVLFSLILSTKVLAVDQKETTNNTSSNSLGIPVANVNISEGKIIFNTGNNFSLSFKLENGEGIQTGVKYGIKLFSIDTKGQPSYVVDEKVYPEVLNLEPNSTISKEIVYEAPGVLSGDYLLAISSENENGFPFGLAIIGKVSLTSSVKGVEIIYDTCSVKQENKKGEVLKSSDVKLPIIFKLKADDILRLTCTAVNSRNEEVLVTPYFETFYKNLYGKDVPVDNNNSTPVSFNKLEKKTFSVVLPQATEPQNYYIKTSLKGSDFSSNAVAVSYLVDGFNATISNLFFDKDYYKKGDTAQISILWNSNGRLEGDIYLGLSMVNKNNKNCGEALSKVLPIDTQNKKTEIPFSIEKNCVNPMATISLSDNKGNVLAQKTFNVETKSISPLNKYKLIIIIIVAIFVFIAGIFINSKKKKDINGNSVTDGTMNNTAKTLMILLLVVVSSLIPLSSVRAATYALPNNVSFTINMTTGSTYAPGGNITVTSSLSLNGQPASNYSLTAYDSTVGPGTSCTFSIPTGTCNFQALGYPASSSIVYKLNFPNHISSQVLATYNIYNPGHVNGVEPDVTLDYNTTETQYYDISWRFENPYLNMIRKTQTVTVLAGDRTVYDPFLFLSEAGCQCGDDRYWVLKEQCITPHAENSEKTTIAEGVCFSL